MIMTTNNLKNDLFDFAKELWPLNRSITGEGVRQTLSKIKIHIPNLKIKSIPSGTNVFDWKIPKEWHVNDAWIECPNGEKICEFKKNNLHLVGYSIPIKKKIVINRTSKEPFFST